MAALSLVLSDHRRREIRYRFVALFVSNVSTVVCPIDTDVFKRTAVNVEIEGGRAANNRARSSLDAQL